MWYIQKLNVPCCLSGVRASVFLEDWRFCFSRLLSPVILCYNIVSRTDVVVDFSWTPPCFLDVNFCLWFCEFELICVCDSVSLNWFVFVVLWIRTDLCLWFCEFKLICVRGSVKPLLRVFNSYNLDIFPDDSVNYSDPFFVSVNRIVSTLWLCEPRDVIVCSCGLKRFSTLFNPVNPLKTM